MGPLRTDGFYSYAHKLQMSTCCMLMFRILLTCILKMTLYFNSVHLQDGLVVLLEGLLLVVDVVDLLFVGLLAHVHYQCPRGGNFQISRFFLILISSGWFSSSLNNVISSFLCFVCFCLYVYISSLNMFFVCLCLYVYM